MKIIKYLSKVIFLVWNFFLKLSKNHCIKHYMFFENQFFKMKYFAKTETFDIEYAIFLKTNIFNISCRLI